MLYGAAVIFKPEILSIVASLGQESWVVAAEVRAMYGGLEFGIGLFTLLGLCPAFDYHRAAIMLNAILLTCLALTRILGMLLDGPGVGAFAVSFGATDIPASYNSGALFFFEAPFAILGWVLLAKLRVVSIES